MRKDGNWGDMKATWDEAILLIFLMFTPKTWGNDPIGWSFLGTSCISLIPLAPLSWSWDLTSEVFLELFQRISAKLGGTEEWKLNRGCFEAFGELHPQKINWAVRIVMSKWATRLGFEHQPISMEPENATLFRRKPLWKHLFSESCSKPWKTKTEQRIVFRMIHVKDSLPRGKVCSLDFLGKLLHVQTSGACSAATLQRFTRYVRGTWRKPTSLEDLDLFFRWSLGLVYLPIREWLIFIVNVNVW